MFHILRIFILFFFVAVIVEIDDPNVRVERRLEFSQCLGKPGMLFAPIVTVL